MLSLSFAFGIYGFVSVGFVFFLLHLRFTVVDFLKYGFEVLVQLQLSLQVACILKQLNLFWYFRVARGFAFVLLRFAAAFGYYWIKLGYHGFF